MAQPDHLRISNDDRAVVEQVLGAAYADGRITKDEHDERLSAVWQAKTFGDLRPLTADLIAIEQQVRHEMTPQRADGHPRAVVDVLGASQESERITAIMSSHKRMDPQQWRLRQHTNANIVMGDAKLDLRNAVFEGETVRFHLAVVMGELVLHVPAGVRVQDDSTKIMADVTQKGVLPEPDGPVVVLDGFVLMGSVTVYGPEHKSLKKKLFG